MHSQPDHDNGSAHYVLAGSLIKNCWWPPQSLLVMPSVSHPYLAKNATKLVFTLALYLKQNFRHFAICAVSDVINWHFFRAELWQS